MTDLFSGMFLDAEDGTEETHPQLIPVTFNTELESNWPLFTQNLLPVHEDYYPNAGVMVDYPGVGSLSRYTPYFPFTSSNLNNNFASQVGQNGNFLLVPKAHTQDLTFPTTYGYRPSTLPPPPHINVGSSIQLGPFPPGAFPVLEPQLNFPNNHFDQAFSMPPISSVQKQRTVSQTPKRRNRTAPRMTQQAWKPIESQLYDLVVKQKLGISKIREVIQKNHGVNLT
jgi:hypothetical protein